MDQAASPQYRVEFDTAEPAAHYGAELLGQARILRAEKRTRMQSVEVA